MLVSQKIDIEWRNTDAKNRSTKKLDQFFGRFRKDPGTYSAGLHRSQRAEAEGANFCHQDYP